jgi:AraC-like DNA-binding protein
MVSFHVFGDSFEQAAESFSANYDLPRFVSVPSLKKFSWSSRAAGGDIMTLRSNQFMADMDTTIGSDEEIIVQWARSGQATLSSSRSTVDFDVGLPIMLPNARLTMRLRAVDPDMSVVHINPDFVRTVAEELEEVRFLAFHVAPPVSVSALKNWRRTVELVAAVMLDPHASPGSLLLNAQMSRLIAIAMLTTFPYDFIERKVGAAGAEPSGVREALDFIDLNAHLPIGPADIAAAVGMSVRSLQYALRRHRETTATALIRTTRLQRVREELQAAEPRSGSVTATARTWGFVQLGRFAGNYRTMFGESPSTTLRRRAAR